MAISEPHTCTIDAASDGRSVFAASGIQPANVTPAVRGRTTAPPSIPSGVTATAPGCQEIDIAWTASTDAVSGVKGYNIYRRTTLTGTPTKMTPTPLSVEAFADLVSRRTFYYTITAIDNSNSSVAPVENRT